MATSWPVAVDIPEAARWADYTGVEADLKLVIEICEQLLDNFQTGRLRGCFQEALSTAAVIRYARCFTTGVRSRVTDEILSKLDSADRQFHDDIFALRQRHFAHSVNTFEENRVVAWVSDRPEATEIHDVSVQHGRIASLGVPTVRKLKALAETILGFVTAVLHDEKLRVLELARKLPYEELREREMPEPFAPNWADINERR